MSFDARSLCFSIQDVTQVGDARRAASRLAERAGLDENAVGRTAILVTELGNNLHRHAKEGTLLLRQPEPDQPVIEILAIDKGPGMADVEKCFRDGYSTGGTPGTGLGSVSRLSTSFDVHSVVGVGTALVAQVGNGRPTPNPSRMETASVVVPVHGEELCGDTWAHTWNRSRERIMVADGLGHGRYAAEAADEADVIFRQKEGYPLIEVMQSIHQGLRKTRGASVALAELDFERRLVRYVGVGNIAAVILHEGTTRSLVSQNGTAGHEARKIQEFQYPWPDHAALIMNSDGLVSKWDLTRFPGLAMRHPALVAGVLWRDFKRGRDDTSVVVARERGKK